MSVSPSVNAAESNISDGMQTASYRRAVTGELNDDEIGNFFDSDINER